MIALNEKGNKQCYCYNLFQLLIRSCIQVQLSLYRGFDETISIHGIHLAKSNAILI